MKKLLKTMRLYYERELTAMQRYNAEFAAEFPAQAGKQGMTGGQCDDPHIEPFIQATALSNARTAKLIDDNEYKMIEALLQVNYPHYLQPFRSTAIVRVDLAGGADTMTAPTSLARGAALVARLAKAPLREAEGHICQTDTDSAVPKYSQAYRSARFHLSDVTPCFYFSHRSMLLSYRAWAKCRIECRGADDDFLDVQLSLAGVQRRPARLPAIAAAGAGATVPNKTLPDEVVARYAALIRHRPMQADMLVGVLSDYCAVPERCQPFVGAWASLGAGNRAGLGLQNNVLGQDVMLGGRFWRRGAIVRLWLGPLTRAQFDSFLASGSAARALTALLALFALPNVEFEVRPILRADAVQAASLDGSTPLGHASIVLTEPPTLDHDSTSYSITFSPE